MRSKRNHRKCTPLYVKDTKLNQNRPMETTARTFHYIGAATYNLMGAFERWTTHGFDAIQLGC